MTDHYPTAFSLQIATMDCQILATRAQAYLHIL